MNRILFIIFSFMTLLFGCSDPDKHPASIYVSDKGSEEEILAAKEIRKYIYYRTNELLPMITVKESSQISGDAIVVGSSGNELMKINGFNPPEPNSEQFILKTLEAPSGKQLYVCGGAPVSTLYAAYHLAEQMGVGFYLDGDVIPDKQIPFVLPKLNITQSPLFNRRGIQPFHDFPEGPDWWNKEDYCAVLAQLPKLKMNFFGLHTYPEGRVGPEPLVWIGLPEDINPDGTVKTACHARHFTTQNGTWGYTPVKTSDYSFGTSQLFDRDDFGADYMRNRSPWPKPKDEANLFNDMGRLLADVLPFANKLGVKTCIGNEVPLVLPNQVIDLLKKRGLDPESSDVRQRIYEGIFTRIEKTHPLDFYWFWTPERWTWNPETKEDLAKAIRDFDAAIKAYQAIKPSFKLATCGWVLGPMSDRALFDKYLPKSVAFSCINRHVGWDPIDSAFVRVNDREKWAIPWLEDDGATIIPQFWVGRMRRDAADASAYGCNGLLGIHWRTRVLSMNVSALAKSAWRRDAIHHVSLDKDSINRVLLAKDAMNRVSTASLNQYLDSMEGKDRKIRDLQSHDFYADWCKIQFGESSSLDSLAVIFSSLDGVKEKTIDLKAEKTRLPRPSCWMNGPGNVFVNRHPWDSVKVQYDFIDRIEQLRPTISGKGNIERFDYWLNQFKYMKAIDKLACSMGVYQKLSVQTRLIASLPDQKDKSNFAKEKLLPLVEQEARELEEVHRYLISTISNWGEIGNVTNWQQHIIPYQFQNQVEEIVKLTGDSTWVADLLSKNLSDDQHISTSAHLSISKMIVPSPQTIIRKGKDYQVKVTTFNLKPAKIKMYWRILGQKRFNESDLIQTSKNYWLATIPSSEISDDFEYYITADNKKEYIFPASAPAISFAVTRF